MSISPLSVARVLIESILFDSKTDNFSSRPFSYVFHRKSRYRVYCLQLYCRDRHCHRALHLHPFSRQLTRSLRLLPGYARCSPGVTLSISIFSITSSLCFCLLLAIVKCLYNPRMDVLV